MEPMQEPPAAGSPPFARHASCLAEDHWHAWQQEFVGEWYRLAEGCADMHQTADLAIEAYSRYRHRPAAAAARELWE